MKFTIYGQVLSQKNSKQIAINRRTNRPFVMSNPRIQDWKKEMSAQLLAVDKIKGPVQISISIWNKDKRKRDLDNQGTSILDLLKNNDIIEDDNCFILQKITVEFAGIDKENPRAEINIESL